jgi:mttA/Hcf106 family protein
MPSGRPASVATFVEGARMLGSIAMPEPLIIFVIALVVFGPRGLPELGHATNP